MTPEQWVTIQEVFAGALEREPAERPGYLIAACTDASLRQEVELMIAAHEQRDSGFLEPPAARSKEALKPGSRIGAYEVLGAIGAGGMGEVYRARDNKLGRDVAIKVLPAVFANDADRLARFQREAKFLASLNHPNIASIYGLEDSVNIRALIMELVEGPTLADRIKTGPIPINEALPIAKQICEALEYAHERGIVHRDLKPANVKISRDDTVKILDFGLAKAIQGEAEARSAGDSPTLRERATRAGVLLGTAAYMSPEQAKDRPVDRRADIWAFGCVLYEMLTGKKGFLADTVTETLAAVLKNEPDWTLLPSSTPIHVRVLLHRCLQKDPKQRLRDIGDARISLDEVLSGKAETTSGAVVVPPLWRRALPWAVLAGALLGLTAILSALLYWGRRPPAAEPVRFEVPRPAGSIDFTLSPNGRQLAYLATGPGGRNVVWIRALDSIEPHILPGTEDVVNPVFWSPDSRFVVFQVGTRLEKVDVSGGPPQRICDVNTPWGALGGAWNREGTIIFGSENGIMQVPAAGGVPTLVTTSGRNEVNVFPSFLPDGRHFVYLKAANRAGIYIGSLDVKPEQQSSRQLRATDSGAVYAPSAEAGMGRLLFVRDGNLLVQPFDERRLDLVGEPVQLVPRVATVGFEVFSASSNEVLAYQSSETVEGFSAPAWFDRNGKELGGAVGDAGRYLYYDLGLSPDAANAAVSRSNPTSPDDVEGLWLIDLVRGVSTRFTVDPPSGESPVWSPDGKRIAFASVRTGGEGILQRASNGASGEQVLVPPTGDRMVADDWSRDGRFLLFARVDPKTKCDLWVLPLASDGTRGGAPAPFANTGFNEDQGQFSPDTHWIAYVSDESGRFEVYVRPFPAPPGGGSKTQISRAGGMQPRWRRDGKELFYFSLDGNLMAVDATQGPVFKAGVPRSLFQSHIARNGRQSTLDAFAWGVTPDGKRFLINTNKNKSWPITVVLNWDAELKK